MSVIKRLAGQTATYGLSSILGRLLNWLLVPLYTRYFLPAEYGIVTELYAYAGLFYVLFTYGMETAFFRYSEKHGHDEKVFSTAAWSLLISSLGLGAILLYFANDFASWLNYPQHGHFIRIFVLILAFDAIAAIPFARLRAENKALRFAVVKLSNIGINVGLNLFFIVLCPAILSGGVHSGLDRVIERIYHPEFGVGYIFLSNLLASAATALLLFPSFRKLKFGFSPALWKQMMRYGAPLLMVGLASVINDNLDKILLKFLLPGSPQFVSAQIGIYGACYKLSILMIIFIQAYRYAAEPFFFSEAKKEGARESYALVMKYFVIAGALIFLGVLFYMPVIKYFIGPRYHEGLYVVPILLLANLFLGIYYNLSVWYKLTDKTLTGGYIAVFGSLITIVGNILLIPLLGYEGSAWATLACYTSMAAVSWYLGQRHFPIRYAHGKIAFYLFFALGLYLLSHLFMEKLLSNNALLVANSILFVFYLVVVYRMEGSDFVAGLKD